MVNGVLIGETFLLPLRAAGGALSEAGFEVGRAFEALLLHELDAGPPADIRRKPTDVAAERRPRQYGNAAIVLGLLQMAGQNRHRSTTIDITASDRGNPARDCDDRAPTAAKIPPSAIPRRANGGIESGEDCSTFSAMLRYMVLIWASMQIPREIGGRIQQDQDPAQWETGQATLKRSGGVFRAYASDQLFDERDVGDA